MIGYWFWEPAVDAVRGSLEQWSLLASFFGWLASVGAGGFQSVFAPLVIVALAIPVCVVASLVLVAWLMTPAMVRLVEARRFPTLERRDGAGFLQSLAWSLGCTLVALAALVVSLPLWFIPPLVLVVPPLIWGWLTYRVFSFDVLACPRQPRGAAPADGGASLAAASAWACSPAISARRRRCSGR